MNRRDFLSFAGGAVALSVIPMNLSAEDYRKSKPSVWEAHTIDDATKAMYGVKDVIQSDEVKLSVPKINSSGGAVPVKFGTTLDAKTIALFQDANPESAVAVYDVNIYDVKKYEAKIKMGASGTIMVLVEGTDGRIYMNKVTTEVAAGGCEG
ncbi:MAG: thiosulfate oxidation carrier protein SoxY [Campylobacteraceae bacterium]|nr:thiosulfate oxidation carrier protein SoxY [Campylobacteraceae bacterium]MBT3881999.1 thiosulfate oxidation carrier protein SoxY [Campylobacteraceae bacterium]MBT4029999.1 thiosulfate oxidation carrier protein SoxY [Campylobacteraceae bacterium]MBT4179959.1 thiosulfate oxidation carrier protein SoxY [Campylobacteraceae bacterium]MBT4572263.1 thiosulfate oxidation carrier protein SoxY [Campylobacteraceae bacterium]